jgi:hypothetical protein
MFIRTSSSTAAEIRLHALIIGNHLHLTTRASAIFASVACLKATAYQCPKLNVKFRSAPTRLAAPPLPSTTSTARAKSCRR